MDDDDATRIVNNLMFLAKEVERMGGHMIIKETGEESHCMTFNVKLELYKKDPEKEDKKW